MKVYVATLLFAILIPTFAHAGLVGSIAPDFSFADVTGKPVSLKQFKGKVVFLDFWAPWCDQCREELPALDLLYKKYSKDGLEVIGIGIDTTESRVAEFLHKAPVTFTVLIDQKSSSRRAYNFRTLPATFVIGRDGVVRNVHLGFGKELLQMYEKEIEDLLKQQ